MAIAVHFIFVLLYLTLQAITWVVIASAIASWLVAFDVINMRNRAANQVVGFLNAITRPLLAPFRRFIPLLGGVDVSPIVLFILIGAILAVLPMIEGAILQALPV